MSPPFKVPVEVDNFEVRRKGGGFEICGTVETPIGRVPICKRVSDEDATRIFRQALQDARAEMERFRKGGGFRGWLKRYFRGGTRACRETCRDWQPVSSAEVLRSPELHRTYVGMLAGAFVAGFCAVRPDECSEAVRR